jgi:predicted hydrocarbon binding protein
MVEEQQVRDFILAESVLVDRGAIGVLYETALKFVGLGIGGILYTAGKKGGARGVELIAKQFKYEGNQLLEAALVAFNRSNWGNASLVRDGDRLVGLKVENSALASSVTGQRKPICHPIAGYIAGFLEEAWKRNVKVHETKCMAVGDPYCMFEFE